MLTLTFPLKPSKYAFFLNLFLYSFCVLLTFTAWLSWNIKLALFLMESLVFLGVVLIKDKDRLHIESLGTTFTDWMMVDENRLHHDVKSQEKAPLGLHLSQVNYYGCCFQLVFKDSNGNRIKKIIWKDSVTSDNWRHLMILNRLQIKK